MLSLVAPSQPETSKVLWMLLYALETSSAVSMESRTA